MDNKPITIKHKGQTVLCWGGSLQETDNILMAFTDSFGYSNETMIENYNYKTDKPFKNWSEAVKYLIDLDSFSGIEQLESC